MAKRKMYAALAALIASPLCAESGPRPVIERRTDTTPAPRGDDLLRSEMLAGHAAARRAVGLPALGWDAALAADAAKYAREMARTRRFAHSPQPRGNPTQGENLWMGTRQAYRYSEMIGHWVEERRFLKAGTVPNLSTTGNFEDVGHYTQIIWRRAERVGCAMASNRRDDYLVCRYSPAGNVVGAAPLAP